MCINAFSLLKGVEIGDSFFCEKKQLQLFRPIIIQTQTNLYTKKVCVHRDSEIRLIIVKTNLVICSKMKSKQKQTRKGSRK